MRFVLLATLVAATPLAAQKSDTWNWSGTVSSGGTFEIRNVNGTIRTEAGGSTVEVSAVKKSKRGSVDAVEIRVEETADGVIICALWPNQRRGTTGCRTDGMERNRKRESWKNDDEVDVAFTVKVPAGLRVRASTVNGDVQALGLRGDAVVSSVNGEARVETTGIAEASTVNGNAYAKLGRAGWTGRMRLSSVNGDVVADLPADAAMSFEASTVNGDITSDFPVSVTGKLRRQNLSGQIGGGGDRSLELSTVNGSVKLLKH
jgi:hypothetical protein